MRKKYFKKKGISPLDSCGFGPHRKAQTPLLLPLPLECRYRDQQLQEWRFSVMGLQLSLFRRRRPAPPTIYNCISTTPFLDADISPTIPNSYSNRRALGMAIAFCFWLLILFCSPLRVICSFQFFLPQFICVCTIVDFSYVERRSDLIEFGGRR